jgi:hypothetical protein
VRQRGLGTRNLWRQKRRNRWRGQGLEWEERMQRLLAKWSLEKRQEKM